MPDIDWVHQALVIPSTGPGRGPGGTIVDGGILRSDGSLVQNGRHRGDRIMEVPPTVPVGQVPLEPGAYLFGGWMQPHFGHFMAFSIGRLWAAHDLHGQVAGVVFLQLHGNRPGASARSVGAAIQEVLMHLGIGGTLPFRVLTAPTRFERLAVPEHLVISGGAPSAQNTRFVGMLRRMQDCSRVKHGLVTPKLYVSRRLLPENLGGMLFEDLLEENLMAEGYSVMYPELLSIAEQVAAYASARQVIFADGSAVHLGIGFLKPENPVAVIARRPPKHPRPGYLLAASLRRSFLVDAVIGGIASLEGEVLTEHATVHGIGILDLARVRDLLVEGGMCSGKGWRIPDATEVETRVSAAIAQRQTTTPGRIVRRVSREEVLKVRQQRVGLAPR